MRPGKEHATGLSPRRRFLEGAALVVGLGTLGGLSRAHALGSNDRLCFGIVGCGGMGTGHVRSLVKRSEEDNLQVQKTMLRDAKSERLVGA